MRQVFEEALVAIHYVGITAVPDLAAKDEIDILVIVDVDIDAISWSASLQGLDYRRGGDLSPGHRFFKRDFGGLRTHKLHLCREGHPQIRKMLRFRDHLRQNSADRSRYQDLKRQLEKIPAGAIQEYLAAKDPFIQSILASIDLNHK